MAELNTKSKEATAQNFYMFFTEILLFVIKFVDPDINSNWQR